MDIKELRTAQGLTQSKLAENAKCNITTIQRLESGERKFCNLRASTAVLLAHALNVDIRKLI